MEDYNLFKMEGVGLNEGLGNEVKQEIENVGIEMPKLLEIAPGITSQLIEPEYFDEKALKAQPKKCFVWILGITGITIPLMMLVSLFLYLCNDNDS